MVLPSPPSSPLLEHDDELPVVATDDLGMVVDEHAAPLRRKKQQDVTIVRKKREPRKYLSKHFTQAKSTRRKSTQGRQVKKEPIEDGGLDQEMPSGTATPATESSAAEPVQTQLQQPRIYYGLNVDELSSDSDLTDVPSDIGPDPFLPSQPSSSKVAAVKVKKRRNPTKSPYFPDIAHRQRQHFLTTLPFPPLDHDRFGLMQERLAHDPFRLLIATIFLNKTPGERAMPIFFELMKQYPTPAALSQAQVEDVTELIRTLGFQNQRARKCVAMAKAWVDAPVVKTKRYRKLNYPCKGDGRDVKEGEVVGEEDTRVAWEISHLPGLGPYSHDSWRMFCRDELLGLSGDWLGKGAAEGFEPEWKRVLPMDKELRAWMTWMWLKEGWIWNKETGRRTKADDDLLRMARDGGVVHETKENEHLIVKGLDEENILDEVAVEQPAGEFLPDTIEKQKV